MSPTAAPRRPSALQGPAFLRLMSHVPSPVLDQKLEGALQGVVALLNQLPGARLQVTVRHGVATLSGTVCHTFHKALAMASLASLIEGRTVRDQVLLAAA